jgi:mono/diheme cytochrome c family protein
VRALSLALLLGLAGCRTEQTLVTPDPHLERMLDQPKTLAYERAPNLPDDTAMQQPPEGVLPYGADIGTSVLQTGFDRPDDPEGTREVPVHVDRALLERGRDRFQTFCATCHGMLGDGASPVADMMNLRKPPSLVALTGEDAYPGTTFRAVRLGFGMMPSYAVQLSIEDTWAIAAYVGALRIARSSRVGDLPPDVRAQLAKEAP